VLDQERAHGGVGVAHGDAGQGLAHLHAALVARRVAERDGRPQGLHVRLELGVAAREVGHGPRREVDAAGGPRRPRKQRAVDRVGQERRERREQAGDHEQGVPQRAVRVALVVAQGALPEAAAVAPHVPVREVLDHEVGQPLAGLAGLVALKVGGHLGDEPLEAGEEPAVGHVLRAPAGLGLEPVEPVHVRVQREELIGARERAEDALRTSTSRLLVEAHGLPDGARGEQVPAHDVGAVGREDAHGLHDVALRLRHLLALGVEHESTDTTLRYAGLSAYIVETASSV
jgi:hypothetical protein